MTKVRTKRRRLTQEELDKIVRAALGTCEEPPGDCAYCGKLTEGRYSIHRDGFCEGPEVPLCSACGAFDTPTLAQIWARIARRSS